MRTGAQAKETLARPIRTDRPGVQRPAAGLPGRGSERLGPDEVRIIREPPVGTLVPVPGGKGNMALLGQALVAILAAIAAAQQ